MSFKPLLTSILSAAVLGSAAHSASADEFGACVARVADANVAAKVQFQQALRDLIVREKPDLGPLANLNMELQVAMARLQRLKFDYLIKSKPSHIVTRKGMSGFTNFDWTDTDDATLITSDDNYRMQSKQVDQLMARNNGHPDWPKLRKFFADVLSAHPDYSSSLTSFQTKMDEMEKHLLTCPTL